MEDRAERVAWFKKAVLPYEPLLRRHLRRLMSPHEVDDMVSETFTRAYGSPNWGSVTSGGAYVFTIARNLVRDAARRSKIVSFETYADLEVLQIADGRASPETVVTARDELRILRSAIDALPSRCREVFLLRRVDDLSNAQVGDRLGLSVKTVERHMTRALAHLSLALGQGETSTQADPGATWQTRAEQMPTQLEGVRHS